jgi:histidinol phosphatase-like PHP family hydrolase
MELIDLHTHTLLTDGDLIAAELVARAHHNGYTAIGITDHVDASNLEWIAGAMLRAAEALNRHQPVTVIPGVELTHVPPGQIAELAEGARALGIGLAAERGICLELSARRGHCMANGHVARVGLAAGARLVINTDGHAPEDLLTEASWHAVARGAGLTAEQAEQAARNSAALVEKLTAKLSRS